MWDITKPRGALSLGFYRSEFLTYLTHKDYAMSVGLRLDKWRFVEEWSQAQNAGASCGQKFDCLDQPC
jgi:hypothetical protein